MNSSSPSELRGKIPAIVVSWLLGVGVTLSWNSVLTIGDYYYHLFPRYHPGRVLPLVSQPFSLITSALYSYHAYSNINTRKRTLFGYTLFALSLSGLIAIDAATSAGGGLGCYIAICALVASFGVASAHVEGGVLGELSFMCPEFVQSFVAGLAASGASTSFLRLITKAAFDNNKKGLREGVMLFLGISTLFELLCIILYAYVFDHIPIVRHFREKAAALRGARGADDDVTSSKIISTSDLILQNIDYALAVFLTYALTLSIFPGFLYENTGRQHELGSWYALILIAVFNACDLMARYVPFRIESRRGLMVASVSRLLLVPCFYVTSEYGQEGWMIMLVSVLGLTNGYLTVCIFTVAPTGYSAPEQNALGNLLVFFLLSGLFSGACLDLLWTLKK
ncbi:equilibrative nucleotide transporter 3 [Phtheirospermum japonicum]|uniref:Equilibrative nucleotide transporter 3 n=1 Tax=Phtheirospermum japonicum TaxID=374723 RepID=A0A830CRE9_9LAMI|nr:equilibrative nucleotide transporter 3 [Phtheirospermum japonicum]